MGRIQKVLQRDIQGWAAFVSALSFLLCVDRFVQSLREAIRSSPWSRYLALAGAAILILATVLSFRRELRRPPEAPAPPARSEEAKAGAAVKNAEPGELRRS